MLRKAVKILLAAVALATAPCIVAAPPVNEWEINSTTDDRNGDEIRREGIEVTVRDNTLIITLEQASKVELFTILGQRVAERRLPAGTSRLTLRQRGVYILKVGSNTIRINI